MCNPMSRILVPLQQDRLKENMPKLRKPDWNEATYEVVTFWIGFILGALLF